MTDGQRRRATLRIMELCSNDDSSVIDWFGKKKDELGLVMGVGVVTKMGTKSYLLAAVPNDCLRSLSRANHTVSNAHFARTRRWLKGAYDLTCKCECEQGRGWRWQGGFD